MKILAVVLGLLMSVSSFAVNEKEGENNSETNESVAAVTMIQGQIIDKVTGDALTGVTVRLSDGTEAYTDFNGNFTFQNVKPGKYQIQASYISYENAVFENIKCESSETMTLKIQLKNL